MAKLCYYAHSMHLYGSPQEKRDIEFLKALGFDVYNPNNKHLQSRCNKEKNLGGSGMMTFLEEIHRCDVIAFRAHPDGKIPAGVYKEITEFAEGKPVFEIPWGIERRGLTLDETRAYLREMGER